MSNITTAVRDTNTNARIKRTVIKTLEYLALLLACFIALLPLWSSFTTSFKTAEEYGTTNAMALPQNWLNFENYSQVWTQGDMLRAFLTSASVVVVVVTVSVMMGSMLAYVLNRFRFPGNGLIRNLFMIATLIPGIAMQVTTYQIMKDLGFLNSIVGYMILMSGTDVISIYIFLQYFENLDGALDESAVLEGCTYFGVFFKILLPLTKPAIITVAVLKGVGRVQRVLQREPLPAVQFLADDFHGAVFLLRPLQELLQHHLRRRAADADPQPDRVPVLPEAGVRGPGQRICEGLKNRLTLHWQS